MKKSLLILGMTLFAGVTFAQVENEVVTGESYANDVFYSLENGTVTTVARDDWDIALAVPPIELGVSVLTNASSGVELYAYLNGDTADWATLDTTGMVWTPMYNSIETFGEGAFSSNASVHPDYGWGTYGGMGLITGDSLFVMKTRAGTFKKIAIIQRIAAQGIWEFKYANLDGSEEQMVSVNTNQYFGNFIYYSIDTNEEIDREPASSDWDLLFTKYWDYTIPYSVTGILTNEMYIEAQEVKEEGLDQSTFVDFEEAAFETNISIIGSDWKSFNMTTFAYDVDTTTVYFLKRSADADSAYYKIYFTGFTGMSEGKYTFMQEELSLVSVPESGIIQLLEVYPNPASENLNVVFDHVGPTEIQVIDMTGRTVLNRNYSSGGFTNLSLDISQLNPGLFFLKLDAGNKTSVVRFITQ